MTTSQFENPDALPQPIGEYKPVDTWQAHVNALFYALQGGKVHEYYQTFASTDYRLAHSLAADYYERAVKRDKSIRTPVGGEASSLKILELGPGNGNLAACFLSHLKTLDKDGLIYPRVRYVLVDPRADALDAAKAHPDLAPHLLQVETITGTGDALTGVADGSVDRIMCNELWNELPTKLMLRRDGEYEEEFVRPNLNEKRQAEIEDWSGFVWAFDGKDAETLKRVGFALEDIVWEREYRKVEWKDVPYRKTIIEFLKCIDEKVLIPVNLGAFGILKEAKRVLAPQAIGLSGFDPGTAELRVLNDPEKPCYGQFGGQYSFIVNFALLEGVAKHLGFGSVVVEAQREFLGRSLGTNVLSLMDVLATHPSAPTLRPWQQDRLVLQTMRVLNERYRSPYSRPVHFPLRPDLPAEYRQEVEDLAKALPSNGVPDTVAYLTEAEVLECTKQLEVLGYDSETLKFAFTAPPNGIEYFHFSCRPR